MTLIDPGLTVDSRSVSLENTRYGHKPKNFSLVVSAALVALVIWLSFLIWARGKTMLLPSFACFFCMAVYTFLGPGLAFAFQMFCFVFCPVNERGRGWCGMGCGVVGVDETNNVLFLVVLGLNLEVCCFGLQNDCKGLIR